MHYQVAIINKGYHAIHNFTEREYVYKSVEVTWSRSDIKPQKMKGKFHTDDGTWWDEWWSLDSKTPIVLMRSIGVDEILDTWTHF